MMKAIITYHSVDDSGSVISTHPARFEQHLDILMDRNVPVVALRELLDPGSEGGVALTFDDGFVNFAELAWPMLRKRGLPATLFVATDWVGGENAWDPGDGRIPRLPLMGWPTLTQFAREGLDVQSHTCSHPRLPDLPDDAIVRELVESRAAIAERFGHESRVLAYPYGAYDSRVVAATRSAGYAYAVTTNLYTLDLEGCSQWTLPRLDAFYLAKPGVMEMWGTPALLRYVAFRRTARRARAALAGLRARMTA